MRLAKMEETALTTRKLFLEIEPDDLQTEVEEAYQELSKEAQIPGFRKGRVPRRFLEFRFDKEIKKESFGDAVRKALAQAVEENDLRVVGTPDISDSSYEEAREKVAQEPIQLEVTVEVIPQFELPEYKQQTVPYEPFVVDDAMIDTYLKRIQEDKAYYVSVDNRDSQVGDYLVVDCQFQRDGKDVPELAMDKRVMAGIATVPASKAFEENFVGRKKGDRFEFDYPTQEGDGFHIDGVDSVLHVNSKVHQINERIVPPLDDEFAKDNGQDDLEGLRNSLRTFFNYRAEETQRERKQEAVQTFLMDKCDVNVPQALINLHYYRLRYMRNQDDPKFEQRLTAEQKSNLEVNTMFEAEQRAKLEIILDQIAEVENLSISDDEYYDEMVSVAQSRGEKNVDRFISEVYRRGDEEEYRKVLLRGKVRDWLVEQNTFETSTTSEA